MLINDLGELGDLIRRRRNQRGLSQTELANLIGTTRQWVSRLEKGKNDIGTARLLAVLDALELNLDIRAPRAAVASAPLEAATQSLISPETLSALRTMADRMRTTSASVLSESYLKGLRSAPESRTQDSRFYGIEAARRQMFEASERISQQKAALHQSSVEQPLNRTPRPGDDKT